MTRDQWAELAIVLGTPFVCGMGISAISEHLAWQHFFVPAVYMILAMQYVGNLPGTEEGGEEESTPPTRQPS